MMQKLFAECSGIALLLLAVVGLALMGAALLDGNDAVALLAMAVVTGCILYVVITTLDPISSAHFNPAVTWAFTLRREIIATGAGF